MWFLLQLIDHEVHESNEVTGQSLGAGPGGSGLWGPLPLSPNPLLPPLRSLSPQGGREEGSCQVGVMGAAQIGHQTLSSRDPLPIL